MSTASVSHSYTWYVGAFISLNTDFTPECFLFQVNFRDGQLPSTLRTIRISNAKQITVTQDTFSSLFDLQNIHISDIGTVQIFGNNWSQIKRPGEVKITVDHVSQLILDDGTFSGWSDPGPKIVIRNVTRCFVEAFAFGSGSVIQRATFENVGRLWLKNGSFRADVDHLELSKVLLPDGCQDGFFGGRVGNLSLSSVRVGEVHRGCLQADDGWSSLEIRYSSLGDIHGLGVTGSINNITIEDAHLGRISTSGLQAKVSTFTLNRCTVKELTTDAFDVHFSRSVSLQTSTITFLRANAFRRVISPTSSASALTFRRISVHTADDRSLAFSKPTQPTVLDITLPSSCDCGVDRLALRLVVGDAMPHNTTDHQRRTARQLVDQARCLAGPNSPTLTEFYCRSCPVQGGSTVLCSPLVARTGLEEYESVIWPSKVVIPLLLLILVVLLMAVGTSALALKGRLSRRRKEAPPSSWQGGNRGELVDVPEPLYSEILENVPSHDRQTIPEVAADSAAGQHRILQPEPEPEPEPELEPKYREANAPDQPTARVQSSLYVEMSPVYVILPGQPLYVNCAGTSQHQPLYENWDAEEGRKHQQAE